MPFTPNLGTLPGPQRALWPELGSTPEDFTLYGGTALALRLGHRTSVDFDFFSRVSFDPQQLAASLPYLKDAEIIQASANTLTCRADRGGPVLLSYFGGLDLGQVNARDRAPDIRLYVASLLDISGTKALVVQKRAEAKDYLDIDALIQNGIDLPHILAAGKVVYGQKFNPLISLKALSFFDDVPSLPEEVRIRLRMASAQVNLAALPILSPDEESDNKGQ